MAKNIRASAATGIPLVVRNVTLGPTSILRKGCLGGGVSPPKHQLSPSNCDIQGDCTRVKLNFTHTYGGEETTDTTASSGKGSGAIANNIASFVDSEMGSTALGQATIAHLSQSRDDDGDLFSQDL